MNHLNTFFIHKTNIKTHDKYAYPVMEAGHRYGDLCLLPLKYLLNGKSVTLVNYKDLPQGVWEYSLFPEKKTFGWVLLAIALLIPGLLLGTALKGLSYLSSTIRERHKLVVLHFTPFERGITIGSENQRLGANSIIDELDKLYINNPFGRPTPSLTIYAKPGTTIRRNTIFDLKPQKTNLVDVTVDIQEKIYGKVVNA